MSVPPDLALLMSRAPVYHDADGRVPEADGARCSVVQAASVVKRG